MNKKLFILSLIILLFLPISILAKDFGYKIIGSNSSTISANYAVSSGVVYNPEFDGILDSIEIYAVGTGVNVKTAIYDSDFNLIGQTNSAVLGNTPDWIKMIFIETVNVYAEKNYYLAFKVDVSDNLFYWNDTGIASVYASNPYIDDWLNPISWSSSVNREYSIYASYSLPPITSETLILNSFFAYFFATGENLKVMIAYSLLIVIFGGFLCYILTRD